MSETDSTERHGAKRAVFGRVSGSYARLREGESEEKEPLENPEQSRIPSVFLGKGDPSDAQDHLRKRPEGRRFEGGKRNAARMRGSVGDGHGKGGRLGELTGRSWGEGETLAELQCCRAFGGARNGNGDLKKQRRTLSMSLSAAATAHKRTTCGRMLFGRRLGCPRVTRSRLSRSAPERTPGRELSRGRCIGVRAV